jgi:hypothetical protein
MSASRYAWAISPKSSQMAVLASTAAGKWTPAQMRLSPQSEANSVQVSQRSSVSPRPSLASRCKLIRQIRYSRAERIRGLFFLSTRKTGHWTARTISLLTRQS